MNEQGTPPPLPETEPQTGEPDPIVLDQPDQQVDLTVDPTDRLPDVEEITFQPRDVETSAPTTRLPTTPSKARFMPKRRYATLVALAETLIPRGGQIPYSAGDVGVGERIDASFPTLEPSTRKLLLRLLAAWEWQSMLSRRPRRFSKLGPKARLAAVQRASKSKLPGRRQILEVLKVWCFNTWASTTPVEHAVGFTYSCVETTPPRDGAALEVVQYPQVSADHVEECDAVVVGSGAGGATMAKEIAEVGLSVIVLEEGAYYTRRDFTGPPWERYQRFYRQNGTTAAFGVPTIPLPLGKAVGGTTLVNSGTCFRAPDYVLARWEREWGIEGIEAEGMRPYFDRVERIMKVKPVPEELLGQNARVFRRGVDSLGFHGEPIRRNIEGCRGCGVCAFGCPSDAKQSTHISYLPIAQRRGATIYANCRVDRVIIEDGRARGVEASLLDPSTGEPRARLHVKAKVVVVAAGTIHTPGLLERSGAGNRSGQLGRNLRIHPAAGAAGLFEEDIFSWRGTLQPYFVDEWHEADDMMVEVTSAVPSISGGTIPGAGEGAKDLFARLRNLCTAGLMVADTSSGRVIPRKDKEPLILYSLNRLDARRIARGLARVSEILLAAGAQGVFTGLPRARYITRKEELDGVKEESVRPGALRLTAFHPTGTARMGADPSRCIVDPWGEVHGVPNLFVADGSVLPGCPAVNPQITIMALATRTADHLVRHGARYFV